MTTDNTQAPAQPAHLLARLEAAEAAYVEAVRLHNLTLDELKAALQPVIAKQGAVK